MSGCDLNGYYLAWANFMLAQLQGADLTDTNCYGAFFVGANLDGTIFDGANITCIF